MLGRQTQNDVEISLYEIENNNDDEIKVKVTVKNCSNRFFALLDFQSRLLLMDENGKIVLENPEESNGNSSQPEKTIDTPIPNLWMKPDRELISGEISIPRKKWEDHKQQSLLLEVSTGSRLFRIPFYPQVPTIAPKDSTNEN